MKRQSTDDVIKIDLSKPKEQEEENVVEEKQPVAEESTTDEAVGEQNPESEPEQKSEEQVSEDEQSSVLSEVTEEEDVQEKTEELTEEVKEAVEEQKETGVELPENIQKVVDFMNETGGSLEDYVRLNQDYSSLDDKVLLSEYYKQTKPHLDNEEINFLMEDSFSYDEDVDEERDIKRKKLAFKEQVANAKSHLDGQKSKYYEEIKAGSRLTPEAKKLWTSLIDTTKSRKRLKNSRKTN